MKWPLLGIIVLLFIIAILVQGANLFTGAATTQSFVTIIAPVPPVIPPGPPAIAPAAPAVPAVPPAPPAAAPAEKVNYIGDFAVRRVYNVTMDLNEKWIFTYKNVNHTITEVYANTDYAEFTVSSSSLLHVKVNLHETVQIDCDVNGYSDVKITVNKIDGSKVDVTLEIPWEEMLFAGIGITSVIYILLLLVALLVIDTLVHHRKAGHIFKHVGKVQK